LNAPSYRLASLSSTFPLRARLRGSMGPSTVLASGRIWLLHSYPDRYKRNIKAVSSTPFASVSKTYCACSLTFIQVVASFINCPCISRHPISLSWSPRSSCTPARQVHATGISASILIISMAYLNVVLKSPSTKAIRRLVFSSSNSGGIFLERAP
jgi:hypothetical protein